MIIIIIVLVTAYLAFQIGRKYDRGRDEVESGRKEVARAERGRRGAMRLKPIRIRR